ncbi:hypothetical protein ONE63_003892 [Megalurothrips usitatus]|uniref:Ribosomal RNA-processing protein 14/surfeit locus protein 6 C-terminal domain-containing protein n=1 Tax=Megalurothrips usitatus TaxID=439358 RepID=A0AAV7X8C8_9NEOP|nr:hypothetical protein ONE63_003892 [Megalurothrips usitatus]
MVFSKFDLSEIDAAQFDKKEKKKKAAKDPKKILEKLKKKKELIQKLKSEGKTEKVFRLKNKDAWANALKRAEGIKVKDDPVLLTKTIKREQSYKKSRAKKWTDRKKGQEKAQQKLIQKRESNLNQRVEAKKEKNKKKLIKKGRLIPGISSGF